MKFPLNPQFIIITPAKPLSSFFGFSFFIAAKRKPPHRQIPHLPVQQLPLTHFLPQDFPIAHNYLQFSGTE